MVRSAEPAFGPGGGVEPVWAARGADGDVYVLGDNIFSVRAPLSGHAGRPERSSDPGALHFFEDWKFHSGFAEYLLWRAADSFERDGGGYRPDGFGAGE